MDQNLLNTIIAAAVPTLAIVAAFVRNETALTTLGGRILALENRITALETRLDGRIETLDRDFRGRIETLDRDLRGRIETLDRDLRSRLETLDRDLRDWAKITMQHNTDIARLKDKSGLNE